MNAPPVTAAREGAFLARVIADALTLGLPDPDYITMPPTLAGSTATSAAGFQFNDLHGQDPLPAMQAWASRFGVTVDVSAGSGDPATTWHQFDFTHAGVRIHAYAEIAAACAVPGCGHPRDSHWEHGEPDGDRTGCGKVGCKCEGYADEASAILAASVASGTPLTIDEDLPDCARPGCGHPEVSHARQPSQAIADGPCLNSHCACAAYALPQTEAAR